MPCFPLPERWTARAQPWLGTLVEVALPADEASEARFAAAFAAIADVHRCMRPPRRARGESRARPLPVTGPSDLERILRFAHRRPVRVDRETLVVLRLARRLAAASRGRFDVGVPHGQHRHRAGLEALRLTSAGRVRTSVPTALDLGGIAKGHAVDLAVRALRLAGARAGLVNAGGDLRVFGSARWLPVRVRLPGQPDVAVPLFELHEGAAATSADDYRDGRRALLDGRRQRLRSFPGSVTVVAPSCVLADALTKLVALMPVSAPRLLRRFGADAFRIAPGASSVTTTLGASTARVRPLTS
jgi:FAD:protein FMN transferase